MPESSEIFDMIMKEDEVTWQSIIYDLVKSGEINPWDVDISILSRKFLDMLLKLKDMDFRISGKVVLAAALLLKMKSTRFMGSDMADFEELLRDPQPEETQEFFEGDLDEELNQLEQKIKEKPTLIPRTPQPRERKVTIFDLVDALQHALETKKRQVARDTPQVAMESPKKGRDITEVIREVFGKIKAKFSEEGRADLMFDELLPSENKEDKILTFIPLLHLTNERKIDLHQEKHFSPISIKMLKK